MEEAERGSGEEAETSSLAVSGFNSGQDRYPSYGGGALREALVNSSLNPWHPIPCLAHLGTATK